MQKDRLEKEILPRMRQFFKARERCSTEVKEWLLRKGGLSEAGAREALEIFYGQDLVNDGRFLTNRIDFRVREGFGPEYIMNELENAGFSRQEIRENLERITDDLWRDGMLRLIKRKSGKDPVGVLIRRGYDRSMIMRLLKQTS